MIDQTASEELAGRQVWWAWIQERVEVIKNNVSAHAVLRHFGVSVHSDGEEQFSCPFHGPDNKPSARVYPADGSNSSGVWCFVCKQKWDSIALWKKFSQGEDKKFSRVLAEIEKAFGITPPRMSLDGFHNTPKVDQDMESFKALYEASERHLCGARKAYKTLGDMEGFLVAGRVLDKVHYSVTQNSMPPQKGEKILRKLIDKVKAKEKLCPEG